MVILGLIGWGSVRCWLGDLGLLVVGVVVS